MEPIQKTFGFNTSADLNENPITSLETFVQLYNQHNDDLQQAATRDVEKQESFEKKVIQGLLGICGGAAGGVYGCGIGGICGALGAVCAATYGWFCGDVDEVDAAFGFVGSICGGVVGGALSGAIGGSVDVAALAAGRKVHGVVSDVLWFTVGFAVGGAIGNNFDRLVGAPGGAVGGGFGALHATRATVLLAGSFINYRIKKDAKVGMMQETEGVSSESIKPLLNDLKKAEEIWDKMASSDAGQTAETQAGVTEMEKSVRSSQTATGAPFLG